MWKNVLIIWRKKFQTASEIAIPIFFCMCLVYLRNIIDKEDKMQNFEFADLDVFHNGYGTTNDTALLDFWNVWYAPQSAETDKIMDYVKWVMRLNDVQSFDKPNRMIKDLTKQVIKSLNSIQFNYPCPAQFPNDPIDSRSKCVRWAQSYSTPRISTRRTKHT